MSYSSGEVCSGLSEKDNHSERLKFGSVSGITRGAFYLNGTSIRRQSVSNRDMKFGYELHDQIEVISVGKCFAEPGDSGALVFVFISKEGEKHKLKALGIVEGATSMETYLLTPIWDILTALGLPKKLKSFNETLPVMETEEENPLSPLTMPSTSPNIKRNDSGIDSNSGSPTGTSIQPEAAPIAENVRRMDEEIQEQKTEIQSLRRELAEHKESFKTDMEKQRDELKQHVSQSLTPIMAMLESIHSRLPPPT